MLLSLRRYGFFCCCCCAFGFCCCCAGVCTQARRPGAVVGTDPPIAGALFSWSLGDPFLKSNLVAFYYGNLTNPSADPPRVGFLSRVPGDAEEELERAVDEAERNGGVFECECPSWLSLPMVSGKQRY